MKSSSSTNAGVAWRMTAQPIFEAGDDPSDEFVPADRVIPGWANRQ